MTPTETKTTQTTSTPTPKLKTVPTTTLITITPFPKWWKDAKTAPISLSNIGTQVAVPARPGYSIYIATITISVSKETDVYFGFGVFGQSGAMHFGGTDEPRGMVIAMGNSPAPCGEGSFSVTSNGTDAAVGGFVVYYVEKEIQKQAPKGKK